LLLVVLLWLGGFVWFTRDVMEMPLGDIRNPPPHAAGIVVLTGGRERVPAGFDLLAAGAADRLLVSGVDPHIDKLTLLQKILPPGHPARSKSSCCITLGAMAEDTTGNAIETAAWVEKYALQSLILVTANYHMRRSLVEFRQEMPHITLTPFAVQPEYVHVAEWWQYPGTASVLVHEYNKLLLAYAKACLTPLLGHAT